LCYFDRVVEDDRNIGATVSIVKADAAEAVLVLRAASLGVAMN